MLEADGGVVLVDFPDILIRQTVGFLPGQAAVHGCSGTEISQQDRGKPGFAQGADNAGGVCGQQSHVVCLRVVRGLCVEQCTGAQTFHEIFLCAADGLIDRVWHWRLLLIKLLGSARVEGFQGFRRITFRRARPPVSSFFRR